MQLPDLSLDRRWPGFSRLTVSRTPVRSILSFHLGDAPERAALDLYGAGPRAFAGESVVPGAQFASHARVLVMRAGHAEQASHLREALATSRPGYDVAEWSMRHVREIGRAKDAGLVMVPDLNGVYLRACGVLTDWEMVGQAAQAIVHDEPVELAMRCRTETKRQMTWANAKIKEVSTQALVV